MAYYARHHRGMVDEGLLRLVAQDARHFLKLLCLQEQTDTVLAMVHTESHFDQWAKGDDGQSLGLGQTVKAKKKSLRKFWTARGVELGSFDDPTTQTAFTVAEFKEHLGYSRGNVWEAVRRYNGSGRWARHHRQKVAKARAEIFGRPMEKDELAKGCK